MLPADDLHRAWPEAEYVVVPDAGHSAREPRLLPRAGRGDRSLPGAADLTGRPVAVIERVELTLVELKPKVRRTDAIQSFARRRRRSCASFDRDGAIGTGYSYTIGTGGSSIDALLADHLAPRLVGRDADARSRPIWRDLFFHTHATTRRRDHRARAGGDRYRTVGSALPPCEAAAAAVAAGGAKESVCAVYRPKAAGCTSSRAALVERRVAAPRRRASAARRSRSAVRTSRKTLRGCLRCAMRSATAGTS